MDAIPSGPFLFLCALLCGTGFWGEPPTVRFPPPCLPRGDSDPAAQARGRHRRAYASSRRRISRTFAVSSSVAGSMGGAQKGASPTPRSSIAFLITGTNCGATS